MVGRWARLVGLATFSMQLLDAVLALGGGAVLGRFGGCLESLSRPVPAPPPPGLQLGRLQSQVSRILASAQFGRFFANAAARQGGGRLIP